MARLRIPQRSERRPDFVHPRGAQVVVHELLDASPLIFLAELAVPNVQLLGGAEYELLELPADAIDFDEEANDEIAAAEAEALRSADTWLGKDVAVGPSARLAPRTLEHAA